MRVLDRFGRPIISGSSGAPALLTRTVTFGGGTAAIVSADVTPVPLIVPEDSTIIRVVLLTQGGPGSCVVDILKTPFGTYPPTVSICASDLPTISASIDFMDGTLTGWTTAIDADDTLLIELDSSSTFTQITVVLYLQTMVGGGGGGGTPLTVTDGIDAITDVASISIVGGVVSGTSPNAIITLSLPFNITPASHTDEIPFFAATDYFEEVGLDTGGTRFSGATPWTWYNQGSASAILAQGSLTLQAGGTSSTQNGIGQPTAGSTWSYKAYFQVKQTTTLVGAGFMVRDIANNKQVQLGVLSNGNLWWAPMSADVLTTVSTQSWSQGFDGTLSQSIPAWFELAFVAGSFIFSVSRSGVDGSFTPIFTVTLSAAGLTTADIVGLSTIAGDGGDTALICDSFIRTA